MDPRPHLINEPVNDDAIGDDPASADRTPLGPVAAEEGFIVPQTALLLIPLLIFAAFATDIGSWYLEGQKVQRAADAAALAAVAHMPDTAAAEQAAREVAARNGFVDATPADNGDFETGPLPQIRVTTINGDVVDVEIRSTAGSYLGRLVLDSIEIERYAVAEYVQPVHLGNPTSGLGTGTIDEGDLGLPNDEMWLAVTAYCQDHEQGDPFAVGYYDGPQYFNGHRGCGTTDGYVYPEANPNPTFDPDAYVFVVEVQPGSPTIDIDVYEPGVGCSDTGTTNDATWGPLLNFEIYGPSTTRGHRDFVEANAPLRHHQPRLGLVHQQQSERRRLVVARIQPGQPRQRGRLLLREGLQPIPGQHRRPHQRLVLAGGEPQQLLPPGSAVGRVPALRLLHRRPDLPPGLRPRVADPVSPGARHRVAVLPGRGRREPRR